MTQRSAAIAAATRQAHSMFLAGEFPRVIAMLTPLAKKHPNDPELLFQLARSLAHTGRFDEALVRLGRARELSPGTPDIYVEMAVCLQAQGRMNAALSTCQRARELSPRDPGAAARYAELLRITGKHQESYELLKPHIDAGEPDASKAPIYTAFARVCAPLNKHEEGARAIEQILASGVSSPLVRSQLLFQFGSLLDAIGSYDKAWDAAHEANQIRAIKIDTAASDRQVDRTIDAWSKAAIANLPRARKLDSRPVFILGMPRSGTTLVEQILASHSEVFARGEFDMLLRLASELHTQSPGEPPEPHNLSRLTPQRIDRTMRQYIRELSKNSKGAKRITDKTPLNFQHLGLITLLFPEARIIHCLRDPVDTCISCYFQDLGGWLPFTNDLTQLGQFYAQSRRLIDHWKKALGIDILDVQYEELVGDQEAVSRRIVEFIDLPWQESCLRFHETKRVAHTASVEQVRRPIYRSSIGRRSHYERHLGPLVDALGKLANESAS